MLGKTEDRRRRGQQRIRGLESITDSFEQTPGDSEGQGSLACCSPWGHRVRHDLATEQQQIISTIFCVSTRFLLNDRHVLSHLIFKIAL